MLVKSLVYNHLQIFFIMDVIWKKISQWLLLSWLLHKLKREFSDTNLRSEENLADVSTECFSNHQGKSKELYENTNILYTTIHYWGYTLLVWCNWRSKVGCPSLPVSSLVLSSNLGSPALCLGWNAPLQLSSWRARPPTAVVPLVLWPCPALISPLSWWWWFTHACSAMADFSVISLSQAFRCKHCHSCRGYGIPHWTVYRWVVYPWPWLVNNEWRVHPVLKTILTSNFLQTHLMSSFIHET